MKVLGFFGLLCVLYATNISANEGWVRVPVQGIQPTDVEGIFLIESPEQYSRVNLDCVSFIHGMNFYDKDERNDWELTYSFQLSSSGCHNIYKFIKESLDKNLPACIELNVLEDRFELSRKEESCRLGS